MTRLWWAHNVIQTMWLEVLRRFGGGESLPPSLPSPPLPSSPSLLLIRAPWRWLWAGSVPWSGFKRLRDYSTRERGRGWAAKLPLVMPAQVSLDWSTCPESFWPLKGLRDSHLHLFYFVVFFSPRLPRRTASSRWDAPIQLMTNFLNS